jgi:hypothetical protein
MPEAVLRRGSESRQIRFQFWGDEQESGHLRGICQLPPAGDHEVEVEIQDLNLTPVAAELYLTSRPRAVPLPAKLQRHLVDQHPRLLVSPGDLPGLRQKRRGSGAPAWSAIQGLLPSWDKPPFLTAGSRTPSGPELFRGEDRVLVAALIHLVEPTPENMRRARESFLGYLAETRAPDYEPLRIDTQAGETLFILCVGFDWLYDCLSAEERERARHWLFVVAERCWSYLGYERRDYAQAHFLGCALGLLAFAFLFWEEHPRSEEWATYFAGVLQVVLAMLPADGFYPHGINLWIYEYGFLLRWMEIFRVCAGRDLWSASGHWANASRFRTSVTSGDGLLGLTFGDPQYRVAGDAWLHHLIGARTDSTAAFAAGEMLTDVSHEGVDFRASPPRRRVYEFLYREEPGTTPREEPPVVSFADGGHVCVRSRDSLICFRAGLPLGLQRYRSGEYGGYGHADPAQGALLLIHKGELLVCGPGPVYRRETAHHSCPTVDGGGQLGDSLVWLPDFFPPSVLTPAPELRVNGSRVAISADLSPAYLPSAGVVTAHRSLYLDPDRCVVGSDRITCDRRRSIEWHLGSRFPIVAREGGDGPVFLLGPDDSSRVELLVFQPVPLTWESSQAEVVPGYTNDGAPLHMLTLSYENEELEIVWCLVFQPRARYDYTFVPGDPWRINGPDGLVIRRNDRWVHPEGFDAN